MFKLETKQALLKAYKLRNIQLHMDLNDLPPEFAHAARCARVGNYRVAIPSLSITIDEEIKEKPVENRKKLYEKAGHHFLKLAEKFASLDQRSNSQSCLFSARVHYKNAGVELPENIRKNWHDYLYNSKEDIQLVTEL